MEQYCSACGKGLTKADLAIWCRSCMRSYHAYCWERAAGCTTWGCPGKPTLADKEEKEQYKRCPFCGERIVQFAVKCRYCQNPLEKPDLQVASVAASKYPRKDPILTCLLNLLFPGAGYIYLGKTASGLIWFLIACAAWFFTRGFGTILVYFWVIYDSTRQAVIMNRQERKNRNL